MAFDPDAFLAEPSEFDPDAFLGGQVIEQPEVIPETTPMADIGQAAVAGANVLIPNILGLSVDTMRNLANLGIAGYGVARKEIGEALGEEGYIPPETLPPMPGGSEWMQRKIAESSQAMGGGDPFALPDPSDPMQQKAAMAGGILASGAMAPATGIKQAATQVAKMGVPAAGAVGMQEAFPEQPLAPMVGMMAAPAGVAGLGKAKAAIAPKVTATKAFMKAHKLGYKVPPALAKPTKTQQLVEGTAGPVPTKQKASIHNQKVTNTLVKKDINYPEDVPFSVEGLEAVRRQAGQAYDKASKAGTLITDASYSKDLAKIAQKGSALAKEFPQLVKKDVTEMVGKFSGKKLISSEATVEAIKQLRADSSAGFASLDPGTKALAKAQGKMADALDGLLSRNLSKTNPDIVPSLKAARQQIAKTYTIQKSLKGENIDAVALGRELDKGKPLSGAIRDVAEFGQNFKGAAQVNVPQQTNFRPMDVLTGMGGAAATGNAAWLAAAFARPALRTISLSKPYQRLLVRQPSKVVKGAVKKLETIAKMPAGEAQTVAIANLMAELQKSGNSDSNE